MPYFTTIKINLYMYCINNMLVNLLISMQIDKATHESIAI